jgi:hypothetical protein
MIRILATPFPLSRQYIASLSQSSCVSSSLTGEGGGGRGGAESYDREKVRPSINQSILSATHQLESSVISSFKDFGSNCNINLAHLVHLFQFVSQSILDF